MSFHPNTKDHKATHGGYRSKPTKGQVKALLNLYSACQIVHKPVAQNVKVDNKGQYKLNF